MKPFHEIDARDLTKHSIKDTMDAQGYLLIRGLLPARDPGLLLAKIVQTTSGAGWFLPGHDPGQRMVNASKVCGDDDPEFKRIHEEVFRLEAFHAFVHHPSLRDLMQQLVGPKLLVHPKPIARLIFPNCERQTIHAHQDHRAIAGDPECFTAWMPLHDCPPELGPLQILEGSHQFGLQDADPKTGYVSRKIARGGDWVGGSVNAGDVIIFHSLTVHAASPNVSNQMRVSMDCRFQNYEHTLNPSIIVFGGSSNGAKSWEKVYAGWQSTDLQYYWKRLPLQFKPSRSELAQLAQLAEPEAMRARYARILHQLDAEMPAA